MKWLALLGAAALASACHALDPAPLLQRHVQRVLSAQADDQAACDAAFAANPLATYLTALPATAGLRNCVASNANALLAPLSAPNAKCTLTTLVSLLGANSSSAFSEFFSALTAGLATDASTTATTPVDLATVLAGWTDDATKNEAFCSVMNTQVGPCVDALAPVLVTILENKGACCGQLLELYELLKLIVPDGKTLDQTLVKVVNGLHRTMCTTTGGTNAFCGQSLLGLLAGIVQKTGDKSLLSPLLFGAGLPLFALPDGSAACSALETTTFPSRVASGGAFSYGGLSCCTPALASLVESVDDILKQLTGNTLAETLNLVTGLQDAPAAKQFTAPYKTLADCSFKTECGNPSFLLTESTAKPKTSSDSSAKNKRPQELKCTTTELCDADKVCSTVCKEGTAKVAPWVQRAVTYQRNLSYAQPFCFAQLAGTHNSATSLARGWGNRDQLTNKVLDANNSESYLRTNNQFLTLTDQLNLGARFIELDVHYFGGAIRDGHCSRISFAFLDDVSTAIKNTTQALISAGAADTVVVPWQASLMGCLPSLGGLRAENSRAHGDSVKEIATWLKANTNDFVFVYLDVGAEMTTFKKYDEMLALHATAYGDVLLTPADLKKAGAAWKTTPLSDFVKLGKRVAIITNKDEDGDTYFAMDELCGGWADVPGGTAGGAAGTFWGKKINSGSIVRAYSSQLHYATMSEEALSGGSAEGSATEPSALTVATLPVFVNAGVNIVATDGMDGATLQAMVWTWAANEPSQGDTAVEISAADGRWYGVKDKSSIANVACVSSTDRLSWKIAAQGASCPEGFAFGAPTLALENVALTAVLKASSASATAQLNVDVSSLPVITTEDEASYNNSATTSDGNKNSSGANSPTPAGASSKASWSIMVALMAVAVAVVNVQW